MDNNKSSNNSLSVFLLGFLIGAAVVFLLGTKKGKKLLKVISEKGLDNVSNFLEEESVVMDPDEAREDDQKITPKKEITVKDLEKKPRARRFFRGISRHLN